MAQTKTDDAWLQVKSNIETIWSDVSFEDKELRRARGNLQKLVTLIHDKTGEEPSTIRRKMQAVF